MKRVANAVDGEQTRLNLGVLSERAAARNARNVLLIARDGDDYEKDE
jgi:hypothetical protein